jgi:putative endonuclease
MKNSYVYILASKKNGVLYVGVTSNLIKRLFEHRNALTESFTSQYHVKKLVYYELHTSIIEAIKREKRIKSWKRQWKINLIEKSNPEWEDLYDEIC